MVVQANKYLEHVNSEIHRAERVFLDDQVTQAQLVLNTAEDSLQRFYGRNRDFLQSSELHVQESRLLRRVQIAQERYLALSDQLADARLAEARNTPVLAMVDPGVLPAPPTLLRRVAMAVLLLGLVRAFDQYPRPCAGTVALTGAGFGLAIGSRIMGGFGVMSMLGALALLVMIDVQQDGVRSAAARLGQFVLRMLPGIVMMLVVMALIWPWVVSAPFNLLHAIDYFSRFFEEPWQELFGGTPIRVTDMPRTYVPTLLALQLPELFLLLGTGGAISALIAAMRRDIACNRRAVLALIAFAALLPLAVTVLARPAMYNGIRHFVFVLPPLAILGGLAGSWLLERAWPHRAGAALAIALFAIGIASPVIEMARLHPYEYTHFNRIAGGVEGARDRYMLDYWALSFKQASQGLAAEIARRHETKPPDRRWKLAACGPHRSPQVELGPDFETTWDPKGADFALMLGEFYCRRFDAPVWVEVVRAGAVYARVYDLRGRSYETLLTQPGVSGL